MTQGDPRGQARKLLDNRSLSMLVFLEKITMHNVSARLSILFAVLSAAPLALADATLIVEVSGLANANGELYVSVYDSPDNWLGEGVVTTAITKIEEARRGDKVVTELQLPPGEYALTVFYDANGNGQLDTNFIGIPKEPVAMSNNAKMRFGPPKYDDARFELGDEPLVQVIEIEAL